MKLITEYMFLVLKKIAIILILFLPTFLSSTQDTTTTNSEIYFITAQNTLLFLKHKHQYFDSKIAIEDIRTQDRKNWPIAKSNL